MGTPTRRERTRRALAREPVDRLPVQTNLTAAMGKRLAARLGCSFADLDLRLGNHLLRLEVAPGRRRDAEKGVDLDWWGAGWSTETEGYWLASAPLASSDRLEAFAWPDPGAPGLLDGAAKALAEDGGRRLAVPNLGFALFERAWSLRGFERLLMDLLERPAWVEDLLERITEVQVALCRRVVALRAAASPDGPRGVDGGYFGDDYGAQRGTLFSPALWRRFIKPRLARMFAVFREAGLPVILHSDGDIWPILPDLVDIGLNCLNPVQPEVLDPARLRREFGGHLAFYGGISTQTVLSGSSPEEVRRAVRECVATLAPNGTGLILGPSHRMPSDIPLDNVIAMLEAYPDGD